MNTVLAVLLALGVFLPQRPLAEIAADLEKIAAELRGATPPDPVVALPSGGDLQAALNKGGAIELIANGTYQGNFVARVPGTRLKCQAGARLIGQKGHALLVPVGASDIQVEGCTLTTDYDQAVVRLGANDLSQTKIEDEPSSILLKNLTFPTHRGKRAIEINANNVTIENCTVADLWDSAGRDSQAIAILNSSGHVHITGGTLTAGSEIIMVGGDSIKLAGIQTRDILIEGVTLVRPLAWRTDGINRNVKNLLELKAGIDVTIRKVKMAGSWVASQTGEGLVVTPRDRRVVDNVLVEDSEIADVASGLQILGRDYTSFTDGVLHLTMRRTSITTNRALGGGQGRVATISGEPARLEFRDNTFREDGDSILYVYVGSVMNADGTVRKGGPIGALIFAGNRALRGQYGIFLNGYANGGPKGEGLAAATTLDVSGNTFGGDSSAIVMQRNFPTNTYVSRAVFDQQ